MTPESFETRRAGLNTPTLLPLTGFVAWLRKESGRLVPDFDPADGGTKARLLLLLETPSPAILAVDGTTGCVSRDNPAPTSRNLKRFLNVAGVPREDTLIWNAVPYVVHAPGARNRAPSRMEVQDGLRWLPPLLRLLPRLVVAVLAGRVASQAFPVLRAAQPDLPVLTMPHPSPTIVCTSPAIPTRILATLTEAAALLREKAST